MFNDINAIKSAGLKGFKSIRDLLIDPSVPPKHQGVYFILRADTNSPKFMATGSGGFFKGKNPNVSIEELKNNWVDNTRVLYIGKAGGEGKAATLHSRLRQYVRFGQGKNVGHWGGRFIWQIESPNDLLVCWKPIVNESPEDVEAFLINEFKKQFGKRPFANLIG